MRRFFSDEEHARALAWESDVPEERPSFAIGLTEVGIDAKTVWVRLDEGLIPFTATICVDLPEKVRGIHMSRMEEAVTDLAGVRFHDIRDYALCLAEKILVNQRGERAGVRMRGLLPRFRRTAVSEKTSLDSVEVTVAASMRRGRESTPELFIGALLHHMTACPCTQRYQRSMFPDAREMPLPTHSQRSMTRLTVEADGARPSWETLFLCLEEPLHVAQDLLKRPDEAELVIKSHRAPQFAEDAVREVARVVGQRLGGELSKSNRIRIESRSLESIHIHDVCCLLETTLASLLARETIPSPAPGSTG